MYASAMEVALGATECAWSGRTLRSQTARTVPFVTSRNVTPDGAAGSVLAISLLSCLDPYREPILRQRKDARRELGEHTRRVVCPVEVEDRAPARGRLRVQVAPSGERLLTVRGVGEHDEQLVLVRFLERFEGVAPPVDVERQRAGVAIRLGGSEDVGS